MYILKFIELIALFLFIVVAVMLAENRLWEACGSPIVRATGNFLRKMPVEDEDLDK